jgi:dTDP-glucose 4,6-dehydratase
MIMDIDFRACRRRLICSRSTLPGMTNVVITGGAGFIGSNFVRYWTHRHPGDTVVVLDALTYAGNLESLADIRDRFIFVHADIRDQQTVEDSLRRHKIDLVVNFAAESHNSYAILEPRRFFETNVVGTQALLDASRRAGQIRFHHVSTCEVYGDLALDASQAFTEESPYRPRTPYNASKAGGDHAVRAYFETFELPVTISNCANNYGPYQFPEKVLPLFITRALTGRPLPVYRASGNRREWIHVLDHCAAIDAVISSGRIGQTYHVGTGDERSVEDLVDVVLSELSVSPSQRITVDDRPGHDRRYLLDSSKIRLELGWEPQIPFDRGIAEVIRWYRDNEAWWRPLLDVSPVTEGSWGPAVTR